MAAPTSLVVEVDRSEYSRFENDRKEILVTVSAEGSNLLGEQVQVEIRKARFARDIIVATKTVTLVKNTPHSVTETFNLAEILDEKLVPKIRRGDYFIRATSLTLSTVTADSADFMVSLISVARLKADYLHGTDQFSSDTLAVVDQPKIITGITVEDIAQGHPRSGFTLSYNIVIDAYPVITGVTTETFALVNGQTLILHLNGCDTYTATFNTADFGDISAATAAEVVAVINTDIPGVFAEDIGGAVRITGTEDTFSIVVDPNGSATTALGLLGQTAEASVIRTLSWCDGPMVVLTAGTRTYTLIRGDRLGSLSADYIKVRLSSIAALPTQSRAETLFIDRKPLDDDRMRAILDQAISWVEDVEIKVFLEPTRLVTEVDPDILSFPSGTDIPELAGVDFDCVVDAITYLTPAAGRWINFKSPYQPLICFEELYGKLSNVRIVDIALEWIEIHEKSGFVELVPFNQEVAFNFIGLVWIESIRGPVPLPNFWNFTAVAGFRKTPPVLIELVAKKAAMDILTIAGQAFRGGFSSQSISRDGVSESVSYTASATFGIFSATIEDYRKWIEATLVKLRGSFRGVNMVVL